jgi:uncharacterized membrane protein
MKSRTSAALLLVGVFLLGGITGAVSYSLYRADVEASSQKRAERTSPHDIIQDLAEGLKLDPAQKEKLKVIIDQSRERFRAISLQVRPQYDAIRQETRDQMRHILREDQKAKFEEIIQQMDAGRKNRGPHPPR